MSHFTVLVPFKHTEEIEDKLNPYYEQFENDDALAKDMGWIVWEDKTDEVVHVYENNTHYNTGEPWKEFYDSLEDFALDWNGSVKRVIDGKERYGYWYNPNAKWDWYVVGGRWSGLLVLKDGSTADYAPVKDIDWDATADGDREEALTYAFIDHYGEWNSRGEMGWFGMSYDEQDGYDKTFWSFIDSLDGDLFVAIVDCHI